ncbi:hypothetical protein H0O02_05435 [Candidatus Micrarchaeota archaeon]|nr:hypothetical protein [Candidatus Micrarchaeota archaeon]
MKLTCDNIRNAVEKDKDGKGGRDELSSFEKFMEKGKTLMRQTAAYALIGATLVFSSACGKESKGQEEDAEATEQVEDDGGIEADADINAEMAEEAPEIINEEANWDSMPDEDDVSVEIIDDGTEEGDAEEEIITPLNCPTPVEHATPALNPLFETSQTTNIMVSGVSISGDFETHLSMNPDCPYKQCESDDNSAYYFVCAGEDTVNIEGQYYTTMDNVSARLEPVSEETEICPPAEANYPAMVYRGSALEAIRNVTYDFSGGVRAESIAGFSIREPEGLHFEIRGVIHDGLDLSFTPPSTGTYLAYFKKDYAPVTFDVRALDGKGNERIDSYIEAITDGNSGGLYIMSFDSGQRISYELSVRSEYNPGKLCVRCAGGPALVVKEIPLLVGCVRENACGCLGEPTDVRFDTTAIRVSPAAMAASLTITAGMNVPTVTNRADNPEISIEVAYAAPSGSGGITITIEGNVVVSGREHVCSGADPYYVYYDPSIHLFDPANASYVGPSGPDTDTTCTCDFGG